MIWLFPGSFDPPTLGHVDIAERAALLCDVLTVAVSGNPAKHPLFTPAERVSMLRAATAHIPNIRVDMFDGLTAEFAQSIGARAIVRGVRSGDDFAYETRMAQVNARLAHSPETVLLAANPAHAAVSASILRELATLRVSPEVLRQFAPEAAVSALTERFGII